MLAWRLDDHTWMRTEYGNVPSLCKVCTRALYLLLVKTHFKHYVWLWVWRISSSAILWRTADKFYAKRIHPKSSHLTHTSELGLRTQPGKKRFLRSYAFFSCPN